MLLSANVERVSVSYMQDFLWLFSGGWGALTVMPTAYLIGIGASIRIGQESRRDFVVVVKAEGLTFKLL